MNTRRERIIGYDIDIMIYIYDPSSARPELHTIFCKKGKACPVDSNETALHHQSVRNLLRTDFDGRNLKTPRCIPLGEVRRWGGGG